MVADGRRVVAASLAVVGAASGERDQGERNDYNQCVFEIFHFSSILRVGFVFSRVCGITATEQRAVNIGPEATGSGLRLGGDLPRCLSKPCPDKQARFFIRKLKRGIRSIPSNFFRARVLAPIFWVNGGHRDSVDSFQFRLERPMTYRKRKTVESHSRGRRRGEEMPESIRRGVVQVRDLKLWKTNSW